MIAASSKPRPTVNLFFDACCKVAKARCQSARSYGVLIRIGSREAQFRAGTNPDSHQRLGKIPTNLPSIVSVEHSVFRLEGPVWNHCTGVRDGGSIGCNHRLAARIWRLP